ncbi:FMN-binding protein [Novipirellula artificiosorum]|uniref:Na(+)-translocating NADH-quinone reductase subunit C n=1 Tax=Novipirellula artificiosorum TaxID=2528016 RepID=A0A5C6D693_9BACT|nr:FMN-binding protein [Novipirellula artificiosorum]TWU31575.1 Na(+)-translocating NADH-quinone reductase subunit C [Novipirellula artificiosorum]
MSEEQLNVSDSGASAAKIYGVVLSVGVVCSLLIVSTYEFTKPIIQANKLAARELAILEVISDAVTSEAFVLDEATGEFQKASASSEDQNLVFAGYNQKGELAGLALGTKGMGYQDYIHVLYGYSPEQQAIVGISVLESRETPGLGDRIQTDPAFLKNFEKLDVRVDGDKLAHELEYVKAGEKTDEWQIDGISGATISSQATADMLRESTNKWIPRVYSRTDDFRGGTE